MKNIHSETKNEAIRSIVEQIVSNYKESMEIPENEIEGLVEEALEQIGNIDDKIQDAPITQFEVKRRILPFLPFTTYEIKGKMTVRELNDMMERQDRLSFRYTILFVLFIVLVGLGLLTYLKSSGILDGVLA